MPEMKTAKQKILSTLYPWLTRLNKILGNHSLILVNTKNIKPAVPVNNNFVTLNNGNIFSLKEWSGKKILFVNTASDCGYTEQYGELQKLHDNYGHLVKIIAFPSNEFGEQERGADDEIIKFCQDNFGVQFPLAKKTFVKKSKLQHPVFQWLSHKEMNGWNDQAPKWNFCKYLVNEQGVLTHYFDPTISPVSQEMLQAIQ